ncbi:hypothetical protein [Pseudorhodoferax aquiterrae]|uniref:hypothetical protein n=1 Tax=Pseudorhodoferax aquiterrae TaxID=747304 RepID=UPI00167675F5|nr:hypothetical protein [Pseudorhodoferax aquiterrae]
MIETLENIPGYLSALIGSSEVVESHYLERAYHGTSKVAPDDARRELGLPRRGDVLDLLLHVEPPPQWDTERSAFRGTVPFPAYPAFPHQSAAEWAAEHGWVYEVCGFRGYELNSLLDLRIPNGRGGFRRPLMQENETAIPARVPCRFITKVGQVLQGRSGLVVEWCTDWSCS